MKLKTQILLAVLVIFLTVGCVSAADDDTVTSSQPLLGESVGLPAPTYYNITEDTYSNYFDENGTFTVTPSAGENSVVRIGNISNKNFIFNTPNLTISSLSADSVIKDGGIVLNTGAEGAFVSGLVINRTGYDVIGIDNYASNVNIFENVIIMAGDALYNFAAIVVHDSDNVNILENTIFVNATGQYAYGIDLYTNFVENATISNATISGNTITGLSDYYMAGISAMNGVVESEISDNTLILKSNNLTYGIATAKNYANADKSGDLLIDNNTMYLDGDMVYGIESASQIALEITDNKIYIIANGAEGIAVYGLENGLIDGNVLNITGGTLNNSYWDTIPNDNVAILLVGDGAHVSITNNNITGVNVDGISVRTPNNIIDENIINLNSDENIQTTSYGSSTVMGIEVQSSENDITNNIVFVEGIADYNYGIDVWSYPDVITENNIMDNIVAVDSDSDYAAGIYGSKLNESVIKENFVNVLSDGVAYGIAIDEGGVDIVNNTIDVEASNTRAIEVTTLGNSEITGNKIDAVGDAVYGIAAYDIGGINMNNNNITLVEGNLSEAYDTWDLIPSGQAAITVLNSSNSNVTSNIVRNDLNINVSNSEDINVADNEKYMETDLDVVPQVVLQGAGTNFTGKLLDANGKPIIGHHLFVNLTRTSSGASKVYEVVSDYNGEFNIPIYLAAGDYTAQVSYDTTEIQDVTYIESSTDPVVLKVVTELDNRTITALDVDELTKTVGTDTPFTGMLTTFDGTPLAGQHITIELTRTTSGATKTYDVVTDYTGTFTLPINLAVGSYSAAVSYAGTDEYAPEGTDIVPIEVIPQV